MALDADGMKQQLEYRTKMWYKCSAKNYQLAADRKRHLRLIRELRETNDLWHKECKKAEARYLLLADACAKRGITVLLP